MRNGMDRLASGPIDHEVKATYEGARGTVGVSGAAHTPRPRAAHENLRLCYRLCWPVVGFGANGCPNRCSSRGPISAALAMA